MIDYKLYQGRRLVIATQHEKENVIAPILENELGVECFLPSNFETDIFGTFSGEIERKENALNAARKKCLLGMSMMNCDLAIASEGSFGSHPEILLVPADDEILIFIDKKNNIEIVAREISTNTNFNGAQIKNIEELNDFVQKVQFPSHGLIIRKAKNDFTEIVKGIVTFENLYETFNFFIQTNGSAFVETDMRAMNNPSRMKVIEQVTKKLISKINSLCPSCKTPGFGVTEVKQGLPCNNCHYPTKGILSHIYSCQKCSFTFWDKFPNDITSEDPSNCNICNP